MAALDRILDTVAVPVLLLTFAVCAIVSLAGDSATFDETAHIGAGLSYLQRGDFRLNPEHPPLAKSLSGMALIATGKAGADYGSAAWSGGDAWEFGWELLNGPHDAQTRRDPGVRLIPARIPIVILGLLLVLVVYAWSRELWGKEAALLALVMAVTCPTLLAHTRLVTTDLAAALTATLALWCAWRWLRAPSWRRIGATGLALGLALLSKFSCLLLIPALVGLLALAAATKRIAPRHALSGLAVVGAIAWATVWAGYGFRYAPSPEAGATFDWTSITTQGRPPSAPIVFARDHRLAPEAFLYGLAYARAESAFRTTYLDGRESISGSWRYFPEAFLLKTPPAFLALLAWAIAGGLRRTKALDFDAWFLAVPVLGYVAVSMASGFAIGHRHLTPIYPLLCIAIAPLGRPCYGRRARIVLGALAISCVVSFALATPGYLSYFNVLAGGPKHAADRFVDSNLDWGQDLVRLKLWMQAHGAREVDLAYFGTADPRAYGIEFEKVAMVMDFYPELPTTRPGDGRLLAVSQTLLRGVYLDRDRAFAREALRQGLATRAGVESLLKNRDEKRMRGEEVPPFGDAAVAAKLVTADQRATIEDALVPNWLDKVRTTLTPIGRAGDSILIYRVP